MADDYPEVRKRRWHMSKNMVFEPFLIMIEN
jgi:hypothetical protein